MVDVVLINPPVDQAVGRNREAYPLGLACIGAVLRQRGFSVRCIDAYASGMDCQTVVDAVWKEKPLAVGISVLSSSLPYVNALVHALKGSGIGPIIVGGAHITDDPEMTFYLNADFGLRGEVDYVFSDLVERLREHKELGSMFGLVHEREGGYVISEKQVVDAERIPTPARDLFPQEAYEFTTANISRGCPYTCSYCSLSCTRFRLRPIEDVLSEIKQLTAPGIRKIDFIDDVFTFDKAYVGALCERIREEGLQFSWACTTRADLIDERIMAKMKQAGLWRVSFGVETGSEERRRELGKDISDHELVGAFKACRRGGIRTTAYGMIGFPGENIRDMEATISFIKGLRPDYFLLRLTDIVPGTKLYQQALDEGIIDELVWKRYVEGKVPYPIYIPKGVDFTRMKQILLEANKDF